MKRKAFVYGLFFVAMKLTAQTGERPVVLAEILVTPTRTKQELFDLPYTARSISATNIQTRKLSRTMPDALKEIPAVMVQKTAHGQGSPYIRGFTGFRTLCLIDGIRLNNSVFRDGPNQYWNTVDPLTIKSLELVQGPGAVLYGSDAIGGTVNALTFNPLNMDVERTWQSRGYYRYSTAEHSHTVRAEGRAVMDEKIGVQAGISYKDFGDLTAGAGTGEQPHTGYDELDFDAKMEYLIHPDLRLTLAYQSVDQDGAWRTHKTIFGKSFHGTTVGKEKKRVLDQVRHLTYARVQCSDISSFIDGVDLTLSYHVQSEKQFRIKKDDTRDRQGFDVDTVGASLQMTSPSGIGDWLYGMEYYRDFVDSFSRKFNTDGSLKSIGIQGPVADDSTYDTVGIYAQDQILFGDCVDLILGSRYNYIQTDIHQFKDPATGKAASFSGDWDALVGSARILYRVSDDSRVHLFGGVSQGFRAPNLSDLTRLDTARTDELETPSTNLDPERFITCELGVKGAMNNLLFEAAFFYTDIKDLIVRTPTGRIIDGDTEVTKKNSGAGFVQGVELNASTRFLDMWTLWGNLTWMEGEVDTFPTSAPEKKREPMDRIMPLTGNVGLRVDPWDRCWLEAVMTAAAKQDKLSTRDQADTQRIPPGGTPGYAVFTIRGGYAITRNLMLSAAVENIANKNYRIHGSGLNEPGRNLVIAVEAVF